MRQEREDRVPRGIGEQCSKQGGRRGISVVLFGGNVDEGGAIVVSRGVGREKGAESPTGKKFSPSKIDGGIKGRVRPCRKKGIRGRIHGLGGAFLKE